MLCQVHTSLRIRQINTVHSFHLVGAYSRHVNGELQNPLREFVLLVFNQFIPDVIEHIISSPCIVFFYFSPSYYAKNYSNFEEYINRIAVILGSDRKSISHVDSMHILL